MDLIGNLLQSLWDTLHDDPTPFELMVHDDQSTDDSIETLRDWSKKTWPNGEPFLTLVESPHEGFIAKANNRMYAKARGDIFVRLDGDIVCLTRHWVSKVVKIFDQGPPNLGMVGPKQLGIDGKIHACGDWLLHPNGYTHIGAGLNRHAIRWPIMCDHNMGCFYCCKCELFEDIDGYDENCLRGETEDFTLRARLKGWTCLATPEVEFVHYHGLRHARSSKYDSAAGVKSDLEYFEKKWGFNRIAPDLDIVRDRYAGTPLVWNARWFAMETPADPADTSEPLPINQTEWQRYQQDATFRARIDRRISATAQLLKQIDRPQRIVQLGARCGLIAHLLAMQGVTVVGIERSEAKVALARRCVADRDYPAEPPSFAHQPDPRTLPLNDDEADLALVFDVARTASQPFGPAQRSPPRLAAGRNAADREPSWQRGRRSIHRSRTPLHLDAAHQPTRHRPGRAPAHRRSTSTAGPPRRGSTALRKGYEPESYRIS